MRGEIYRLRTPHNATGHEQQGRHYAVVVQSNALPMSTLGDLAGRLTLDELNEVDAALRTVLDL